MDILLPSLPLHKRVFEIQDLNRTPVLLRTWV